MTEAAEPIAAQKQWYQNIWVALLAGYVFAPLGLYLMWRYQRWPLWLKLGCTAFAIVATVAGSYLTTKYVWPLVF